MSDLDDAQGLTDLFVARIQTDLDEFEIQSAYE